MIWGKLPSVVGIWRGRGAAQQSLLRGGSTPRSNLLPFSVPRITSIDKWYPFAYQVKNATFLLTVVNALSFNCELIAKLPCLQGQNTQTGNKP